MKQYQCFDLQDASNAQMIRPPKIAFLLVYCSDLLSLPKATGSLVELEKSHGKNLLHFSGESLLGRSIVSYARCKMLSEVQKWNLKRGRVWGLKTCSWGVWECLKIQQNPCHPWTRFAEFVFMSVNMISHWIDMNVPKHPTVAKPMVELLYCIMDDVPPLSFSKITGIVQHTFQMTNCHGRGWLLLMINKCPYQALYQWGAFLFYRNMIAYSAHVNIYINIH